MRRIGATTGCCLLVGGLAMGLHAQSPGDSLRLRLGLSGNWQAGRLVRMESGELILRQAFQDRPYQLSQIQRLDIWKRRGVVLEVFGAAAAAAAGSATALLTSKDREPFTGSDAGDVAVFAGAGALLGIVYVLASPGKWHRIRTVTGQPIPEGQEAAPPAVSEATPIPRAAPRPERTQVDSLRAAAPPAAPVHVVVPQQEPDSSIRWVGWFAARLYFPRSCGLVAFIPPAQRRYFQREDQARASRYRAAEVVGCLAR